MKAAEFLKELEYLLQDIPEEEKRDAISYYEDYFEEAGEEHWEEVHRELGSPERVAAMIRAELGGSLEEGGAFTDSGYQDERFRDPGYQIARRRELPDVREEAGRSSGASGDSWEEAGRGSKASGSSWRERFCQAGERFRRRAGRKYPPAAGRRRLLRVFLLLALLCVASPVLLGLGGTTAAVITGIACILVLAVVLIGVLTAAACIGAAAVLILGFGILFTDGWSGVLVIGGGIFLLGLALLGVALSALVYGTLLPKGICGVVDWIGGLLHRGRRTRT